ncbi:MAG: winged helix-turn-helix domain-containing protein [Candidatus Aenigmatarchaeota archaeon]
MTLFVLFNKLYQEIKHIIFELNSKVKKALDSQEFDKAKELIDLISKLDFIKKIAKDIQKEIKVNELDECENPEESKKEIKIKRGERTPISEFTLPILKTLIELGGSAPANEVLRGVEEKMKNKLKEVDYELLPNGSSVRWVNTAHWCRLILVKKGFLSSNSSRGIWEITDEGRRYFEQHTLNSSLEF